MKTYTPLQIKECKHYLWFSVKEGYISEDTEQDLLKRKAWEKVYQMMNLGDFYANEKKNWNDDASDYMEQGNDLI